MLQIQTARVCRIPAAVLETDGVKLENLTMRIEILLKLDIDLNLILILFQNNPHQLAARVNASL
jgi:hypothetical protein